MSVTVRDLYVTLRELMETGHRDLPVVVKYDDGDETIILDAAAATKQGGAFRIYGDPETKRVIATPNPEPVVGPSPDDVYVPPEERGSPVIGRSIKQVGDQVLISLDANDPQFDTWTEIVGEHRFEGTELHCADCGTHLAEATFRRCGA